MGLTRRSNRQYFDVSLGAIRRRVSEDTPDAVKRKKSDDSVVWELVFKDMEGILEDILFKTHPEYGNSWVLHIKDGNDEFGLQVHEDSAYGRDLLKKIPNLRQGGVYRFTPYDYERNKKRKTGIFINTQGDERVDSYYQRFEGSNEDGWTVTNLNGYPEYTGAKNDKDEFKIYCLQATKFLRTRAQEHIKTTFHEALPEQGDDAIPVDDNPF